MAKTLRDRCKAILDKIAQDRMLRQHSAVDTLVAFVNSEKGRAADNALEDTLPLILYFGTERDREEFMAIVREAKPGMIARPMP